VRTPEFAALPQPILNQVLDMQLRAQREGYATQFPSAQDYLISVDGKRAGRLLVARTPTGIHVIDIALLDSHRGKGIGGSLLQALCEEARAAGKILSLSVHAANPAQRLYRRLGLLPTASDGVNITMVLVP
jgi:ribosomal protein S18 acetylase RimI-like enzyme